MTTLADLLRTHNELAKQKGETTLKGWKGSKADLEKRIAALKENTLTVAQIARELGLSPKTARGKLRKSGLHKAGDAWPVYERGSAEFERLVAALRGASDVQSDRPSDKSTR